VLQNGPAAKAGIRPGDVITRVDQHPVGNVSDLLTREAGLEPGKPARLQLWRGQGLSEVTVTPGQRPSAPQQRQPR
jgi:serine protease DegQ